MHTVPPFWFLCALNTPVTLCVFNPEHDLCLANGDANYVPPQSALDFARHGAGLMRIVYGPESVAIAADGYASWRASAPDAVVGRIVAWGWDTRLKQTLLKQGADSALMPSDGYIACLRDLQHRTTVLPLQRDAWSVTGADEVAALLARSPRLVLKAPWSGSGRGLRWVDGALSAQDVAWIAKTVAAQRCVIAERRFDVEENFAFEFHIADGIVRLVGLSLFVTQSGVYRHNVLLDDDEIRRRTGVGPDQEKALSQWLQLNIAPRYSGYLGVDLFRTVDGRVVVSELNLRHTMGLVAHRVLQLHPELHGSVWEAKEYVELREVKGLKGS